MMSVIVAYASR